jgi:hypothetical protein
LPFIRFAGIVQSFSLKLEIADRHARNVLPIIRDIQRAGIKSLRDVAAALNARGIATARGGKWYAATVRNAMARDLARDAAGA